MLQNHVPDWIEPMLTSAPSAQIVPAMAYDAATRSSVLFGGVSAFYPGSTYGDTWIWRSGWSQRSPAVSPPARTGASLAYDATTGTVVLFGGESNTDNTIFGDTWTWDGITWTQQFPSVSPPARSARGAMAYDSVSKSIVLFGGENAGGDCCRVFYGDTWIGDGLTWIQRVPLANPPARAAHVLAFDSSLEQVVLFGGTSGPPGALNDTWGWNGITWTQLRLDDEPASRFNAVMDAHPPSDGLLLFGGELSGDFLTNESWLLVPVAAP